MAERASLAVSNAPGVAGPITAEDMRYGLAAGFAPAGLVTTRSGFRPSNLDPGAVTASATADKLVHVAAFQRVHQSVRSGGTYIMTSDSTKDINVLDTQPAHSSGITKHLIIAHQQDVAFGESDSLMRIRLVLGVAGANADPSLAAYPEYVPLARLNITANALTVTQAMIEDLRPADRLTVALGGLLPIATASERNAIVTPYDGMMIYRRDRDWVEIYDGAAWRVQGVAVVSSVADLSAITSPYNGMLAFNTALNVPYRRVGGVWHLAGPISFATPAQTGSGSLGAGLTATIATVNVPDYGVPIKIEVWGTLQTTTPAAGYPCVIQATYDSAVWDTNRIGAVAKTIGTVSGIDSVGHLPPRPSAQLPAGARTVRLLAQAGPGAITVLTDNFHMGVRVLPALP